ncbi:MAG: hypothetical protein KatS3mg015_2751 [Fimbriimonadales bacterium]|nr:MAG: hypothetical protein KatS3mg015_2751 [Fimbriimonadales bacterium]
MTKRLETTYDVFSAWREPELPTEADQRVIELRRWGSVWEPPEDRMFIRFSPSGELRVFRNVPDVAVFAGMLLAHDWTFEYSDDHGVWAAGRYERGRIEDWLPRLRRLGAFELEWLLSVVDSLIYHESSAAWIKEHIERALAELRSKNERSPDSR